MENLKDFIKVYDGVLDDNLCKHVIKEFEESEAYHDRWDRQKSPQFTQLNVCLLYTSPSPRDKRQSRMPSSA